MSRKKQKRKVKIQKKIAERRIEKLFHLAENAALDNKLCLADRYVEIARKISMRYLVKIPNRFKRRFCKHCYTYFLPNVTCRVRVHRGKLVFFCKKCGNFTRFPLKKTKK